MMVFLLLCLQNVRICGLVVTEAGFAFSQSWIPHFLIFAIIICCYPAKETKENFHA